MYDIVQNQGLMINTLVVVPVMAIKKPEVENNCSVDVDIAIVKATNHVECPPKERAYQNEATSRCIVLFTCFG
nr:hypothetical protein [Tanacetum cinerariifolium]